MEKVLSMVGEEFEAVGDLTGVISRVDAADSVPCFLILL